MPGKPALVAALSLLLTGCGMTRPEERVTLEPVVIQVSPGGTTVSSPDPELDELTALQEAGKCEEAKPKLERFLELFPESARFTEAALELGICEEDLGDLERARGYYRYVAARGAGDLGVEGALKAAWSLEELGQPEAAASDYRRIARLPGLPLEMVAGAHLRRAICLFRAGKEKKARKELARGADLRRASPSPSDQILSAEGEARFADAETFAERFRAVKLEYPQRRLTRRIKAKVEALSAARAALERVVAVKDAEWAAAAVYREGELFEEMTQALEEVPLPPALTPAQQALYREELARTQRPLRQQAFDAYQQVLALGERVGLTSDWVDKSRERAAALEPLLKSQVLSPDEP